MEELFDGYIAYFVDGQKHEATYHQGRTELPGGLQLSMESTYGDGGWDLRVNLAGKAELHALFIDLPLEADDVKDFFANGFQSWTESRVRGTEESIPALRSPFPRLMNQSGDYTFYKNTSKKGHLHSHGLTWLRKKKRVRALADQIPQTGHCIFEYRGPDLKFRIRKEVAGLRIEGEELVLHIAAGLGTMDQALDHALKPFAPRSAKAPVTGWTSWYNYYTDIEEGIILENLVAFAKQGIPIDIFQIDDGWQPAVGDWMEANEKFPGGMKAIADQAHRQGIQAGLWLAPFIADQRSQLFQEHRDWFLTYDGEHLVAAGYNPLWAGVMKGRYFILDIYQEPVRAHLKRVFDRILNEWGFDMVKLDFLYAAGFIPRLGRSRGAIMCDAMDFLRECCGEKVILGCGVPLAAAFGKVEYCRVGADIGLHWDTKSLKMLGLRERISTVNSLRSTISRHLLSHRVFLNDPDVFILRSENNKLSADEKHSLFVLNLALGDLVFTSDNIDNYSPETLRKYRSQFPNLPKKVLHIESTNDVHVIVLEIRDRLYAVLANLEDKAQVVELPEGIWFGRETGFMEVGDELELRKRQTRVMVLVEPGNPILGTDGHVFPGLDVEWRENEIRRVKYALPSGKLWWRMEKGGKMPGRGEKMEEGRFDFSSDGGGSIAYAVFSMP